MSPKMKYWTINNNLRLIWKAITVYYPPAKQQFYLYYVQLLQITSPLISMRMYGSLTTGSILQEERSTDSWPHKRRKNYQMELYVWERYAHPWWQIGLLVQCFQSRDLQTFLEEDQTFFWKFEQSAASALGSLWAHSVDPKQHQGPFVKVGWIVEHSLISFVLKMVTLRLQQSREQRRFKVCRFFMLQFCSDHISIKKNCKLKSTRQKSHTSWWMLLLALCELKYF